VIHFVVDGGFVGNQVAVIVLAVVYGVVDGGLELLDSLMEVVVSLVGHIEFHPNRSVNLHRVFTRGLVSINVRGSVSRVLIDCRGVVGFLPPLNGWASALLHCETMMNADVNGAVNLRRKITQTPPTRDMSTGWLAQPGVFLFDRESGRFTPREQGDCKP
jgi:hypothetical protein